MPFSSAGVFLRGLLMGAADIIPGVSGGTIALLNGFLVGSLPVVWQWKRVAQRVEDSHGDLQPVQQFPVLPADVHTYSGQDPQLWFCILLAMVGFVLVWQIHARWGHGEAT